jgi:NAD(P)-dependent dehydrogenase (short-subunit alcohol dehydrogenase family)
MRILITGSSSGIGNGLASVYLSRGADVYGISRRWPDNLGSFPAYYHLSADLTDYDTVSADLPGFLDGVDELDLVVLNAGILGEIRYAREMCLTEMKRVMEINVWANKFLLDILFSEVDVIRQVVGMSSKASLRSTPGWGPYSMSKAGLNMLMNIYSKEHTGTHFIAFAPGLVDSEIQEEIWNIQDAEKYPAAKRLQEARYTDMMPDADTVAPLLIEGIHKAQEYESGGFVDVREM